MSTAPVVRSIEDRRFAAGFLLEHLRYDRPARSSIAPSAGQWECILEEATRHRIAPLAWRVLSAGRMAGMPESVAERFRQVFVRNALRNALLARETAAGVEALSAAGIPVALLKGVHLANFVYDEPALRSMADIDIMVPRDRLAEAERAFLDLGYGPQPRPAIDDYCAWSNHLAKLERNATVVEVHYAIERPGSPFPIDHEVLWQHAADREFGGASVRVLDPAHLLIHLCLHLAYHHQFERAGLKGLIDVSTVLDRLGDDLDVEALVECSLAWHAEAFVRTTLLVARDMLGAPVPAGVLERLGLGPADQRVAGRIRSYVLTPIVNLGDGIEQARRAGFGAFMRGVFPAPVRMREMYGLPPGSGRVWPLYGLRLADLVRRRGGLLARVLARSPAISPTLDREHDREDIEQWARRAAGTSD